MSTITVILIEGDRLSIKDLPFREVMSGLSGSRAVLADLTRGSDPHALDAGYVVIDIDEKLVVDCQGAFSWHHLPKKARDGFRSVFRPF